MSDPKIESWRDLTVWQKAHAVTIDVYRLTKNFPADERFRLTDQLCRAASSIPTNIAEGKGAVRRLSLGNSLLSPAAPLRKPATFSCSRATSPISHLPTTSSRKLGTPRFPK